MNCIGLRTSSARLAPPRRASDSRAARRSGRATPARCRARAACRPPPAAPRCARRGQRLLVAMLHQRDVRLVAADGREHVAGLDHQGETLGLPQRRHRLVEASVLRERHARQRMDDREVPPVAGGVKGGRGLRDVLAHDRCVADLAVAEAQLVVRQADRAGIVGALRLLERAARKAMPRDGSPWAIASLPCRRHSSESRAGWSRSRSSGGCPSASVAWRMSSCRSQASASADAELEQFVAAETGQLESADQEGGRIGARVPFAGPQWLGQVSCGRHGAVVYLVYRRRRLESAHKGRRSARSSRSAGQVALRGSAAKR